VVARPHGGVALSLTERMTWFWHGHWATSISGVSYPLTMQKQNNTLRTHALANFADMAKAMVVDGALNVWLNNNENYIQSPNENLAREFMELMTLGVNKFTQHDVTAAARALTGYSTDQSNGAVTLFPSSTSRPLWSSWARSRNSMPRVSPRWSCPRTRMPDSSRIVCGSGLSRVRQRRPRRSPAVSQAVTYRRSSAPSCTHRRGPIQPTLS